MAKTKLCVVLSALFIVLLCTQAVLAEGQGNNNGNGNTGDNNGNGNNGDNNGNGNKGNDNGNGNKGNDNGNGNNGNGNGNGNNGNNGNGKDKKPDPDTTNYDDLTPSSEGHERAFCKAKGSCSFKTLQCPSECPTRKPKKNKKKKGCLVDCSSKCEATCKWRRPNCNGYGSLCYDPRFVGGDGVMFYFHGAKGGNFAIVSDNNLQINAHFIGSRPFGRTRDYTWVQALSIMFDTHTLVIAAKKISYWDDNVDTLTLKYDGNDVVIPRDGEAEWRSNDGGRQVLIERTDDTNSVRLMVSGLTEIHIKVRPIGKEENKVHKYELPQNDAFAHLETQFKFNNLSHQVEGILGKTYRPHYVNPAKIGVAMPIVGGEDKYQTSSLSSSICKACRFHTQSSSSSLADM